MKEFKLLDSFGNKLHTYMFDNVLEIKGIIQVVHGINEHGMRYKHFAEAMNNAGYIVYVHDHISQGLSRTKKDDERNTVYFGKKGMDVLINGVQTIYERIKVDFPRNNVFLYAHSLGGIITRSALIEDELPYKGIIINGSGFAPTKGIGLALFIGSITKFFRRTKPSNMFDNMFRQTQLKLNEKTEIKHFIEWLTRDPVYTEINKHDAFLYIRLSVSVFVDMLKSIKVINNINNILNMKITQPLLLLSGSHDPATDFGEGVLKLHEILHSEYKDMYVKIYKEGRHDTLQEINREVVFRDIIAFMEGTK